MSYQVIKRSDTEWIIETDDKRQIIATADRVEPLHYLDDGERLLRWLGTPDRLDAMIFTVLAKAGSDMVSPRELKLGLDELTDGDQDLLDRLVLDAIDAFDNEVEIEDDPYQQAVNYASALLYINGILRSVGCPDCRNPNGYRIEVAGKVIREVLYGSDQAVTVEE